MTSECARETVETIDRSTVQGEYSMTSERGSGQIVPRTNSTPSFLHTRTNSTPSICTGGQIVPRRFVQADKQYPKS